MTCMSHSSQAPDPEIAQIAAALDRIGMRRSPGSRGPHRPDGDAGEHGLRGFGHGGPHAHAHGRGKRLGPRGLGPGAGEGGHRAAMGARRMLHAIVHAQRPRSITDLGHAIGVDQPRASRLVQSLADAGLVRRIPDPNDGRRVVIEATKAGRARFEAHAEARAVEVAAAAESLTAEERAELARLLAKLADAWPN